MPDARHGRGSRGDDVFLGDEIRGDGVGAFESSKLLLQRLLLGALPGNTRWGASHRARAAGGGVPRGRRSGLERRFGRGDGGDGRRRRVVRRRALRRARALVALGHLQAVDETTGGCERGRVVSPTFRRGCAARGAVSAPRGAPQLRRGSPWTPRIPARERRRRSSPTRTIPIRARARRAARLGRARLRALGLGRSPVRVRAVRVPAAAISSTRERRRDEVEKSTRRRRSGRRLDGRRSGRRLDGRRRGDFRVGEIRERSGCGFRRGRRRAENLRLLLHLDKCAFARLGDGTRPRNLTPRAEGQSRARVSHGSVLVEAAHHLGDIVAIDERVVRAASAPIFERAGETRHEATRRRRRRAILVAGDYSRVIESIATFAVKRGVFLAPRPAADASSLREFAEPRAESFARGRASTHGGRRRWRLRSPPPRASRRRRPRRSGAPPRRYRPPRPETRAGAIELASRGTPRTRPGERRGRPRSSGEVSREPTLISRERTPPPPREPRPPRLANEATA